MTTLSMADQVKLKLPNVTLVMVETRCHELARLAIEDSIKNLEFGEILVCSDVEIKTSKPSRWVKVPDFDSYDEYGLYSVVVLPKLINTEFALFIQFDSWVLDVEMWTDEYLRYDYIGPPWWYADNENVGCGGFALATTKFLNFIADNMDKYPLKQPFDDVICRKNRPVYESNGFKFAPSNLAINFGFERTGYKGQHFGFHGMFNWTFVLTWSQLVERVKNCFPYHYNKKDALPEIFARLGPKLTERLMQEIKVQEGQTPIQTKYGALYYETPYRGESTCLICDGSCGYIHGTKHE
jgi:hypothetical protein